MSSTNSGSRPPAAGLAIAFTPEAYGLGEHAVVGRRIAGRGFLEAHLRAAPADRLFCYADGEATFSAFQALVDGARPGAQGRFVQRAAPQSLAEVGTLYWPSPAFVGEAWRRAARNPARWSIIGVCHALSSAGILHEIAQMIAGPVEAYDALVCPSHAARAVVETVFEAEEESLRRGVGATRFVRPQLPVIPLGVQAEEFAPSEERRARARAALSLESEEICVLSVGRADHRTKAHPVPMLVALAEAFETCPRLSLLVAGWFASEAEERSFQAWAERLCPGLTIRHVDGRVRSEVLQAYAAGDMFVSLSDNIQESFGLTPLEAMAAGLPCVVSDWDGYRDTVRNGVDGFRIATTAPPPPLGLHLADLYHAGLLAYEDYGVEAALRTVVDVGQTASAITRLAQDEDLCRRMGKAARARAGTFDWSRIVLAYHDLAKDLTELRAAHPAPPSRTSSTHLSPFHLFSGFPTATLSSSALVSVRSLPSMHVIVEDPALVDEQLKSAAQHVVDALRKHSDVRLADLLDAAPLEDRGAVTAAVLRLAKFGAVTFQSTTMDQAGAMVSASGSDR